MRPSGLSMGRGRMSSSWQRSQAGEPLLVYAQPAATDPATTNLMKSRRFEGILFSCFHKGDGTLAGAEPVPEHDHEQRKDENHGGDGIDLGRDAAAQPRPDLQRQGVIAANQEK